MDNKSIRKRFKALIADVESAQTLAEVPNLKRLRGAGAFYRARIGDYRVGMAEEEHAIVFVRVLHRREVYRYFP
ncbi:MAG TPA: type II toxin-antitoxin system RelE/ParE family toxin [Terriglobia bacterium]|nr:type II toxin-antitoxin system RelE/ParE family toxin [Terriglobia bacterium]